MKTLKYLIATITLIAVILACKKDPVNPELKDSDLTVYFDKNGATAVGIAWEGFDVLVGDTLVTKLMVSPIEGTDVKWITQDSILLSDSLEYAYMPTKEEAIIVKFIATRNTYADTIVFNFRAGLSGEKSSLGEWSNIVLERPQTGEFNAEFDIIASKNKINGIFGFSEGNVSSYSMLSAILRFNDKGTIDAYDDKGYKQENELKYLAGVTYNVVMNVNVKEKKYSIKVTPKGGKTVIIAKDYLFRNKTSKISNYAIIAEKDGVADPGTQRFFNMKITTISEFNTPVFTEVDDIKIVAGKRETISISAIDPLGKSVSIRAIDIPRYADFNDLGNGKATLLLKPYEGPTDVGKYTVKITAENSEGTSELTFDIDVVESRDEITITADPKDATLDSNGAMDITSSYNNCIQAGNNKAADEPHVAIILPFKLPEVPLGKKIKSAKIVVTVGNNANYSWSNYDLYAIKGLRSAPDVLSTDFFNDIYDSDDNATAIKRAFMSGKGDNTYPTITGLASDNPIPWISESPVEVELDDASSIALGNHIASVYEADKYLFIRISPDRPQSNPIPNYAAVSIFSADKNVKYTDVVKNSWRPMLVIKFEDL